MTSTQALKAKDRNAVRDPDVRRPVMRGLMTVRTQTSKVNQTMNKLRMTLMGLALCAPVAAYAGQSLTPRLAEVDDIAKTDQAPKFRCTDPGNRSTCQMVHAVVRGNEAFYTADKANG
jgi:hypothetical protein